MGATPSVLFLPEGNGDTRPPHLRRQKMAAARDGGYLEDSNTTGDGSEDDDDTSGETGRASSTDTQQPSASNAVSLSGNARTDSWCLTDLLEDYTYKAHPIPSRVAKADRDAPPAWFTGRTSLPTWSASNGVSFSLNTTSVLETTFRGESCVANDETGNAHSAPVLSAAWHPMFPVRQRHSAPCINNGNGLTSRAIPVDALSPNGQGHRRTATSPPASLEMGFFFSAQAPTLPSPARACAGSLLSPLPCTEEHASRLPAETAEAATMKEASAADQRAAAPPLGSGLDGAEDEAVDSDTYVLRRCETAVARFWNTRTTAARGVAPAVVRQPSATRTQVTSPGEAPHPVNVDGADAACLPVHLPQGAVGLPVLVQSGSERTSRGVDTSEVHLPPPSERAAEDRSTTPKTVRQGFAGERPHRSYMPARHRDNRRASSSKPNSFQSRHPFVRCRTSCVSIILPETEDLV